MWQKWCALKTNIENVSGTVSAWEVYSWECSAQAKLLEPFSIAANKKAYMSDSALVIIYFWDGENVEGVKELLGGGPWKENMRNGCLVWWGKSQIV